MMKRYRQTHPDISGVKIGNSGLTMGRIGCTTCCISSIHSYFYPINPVKPQDLARQAGLYTLGGLIIWARLSLRGMRFERRTFGRNDVEIRAAIKDPDRAVILQVNNESHWVVATGVSFLRNDFVAHDPLTGGSCNVLAKYGNITGAAYFRRA